MQTNTTASNPSYLGHWILLGATCNLAGWALSAVDQLHSLGLIIVIPIIWILLIRLCGLEFQKLSIRPLATSLKKRFSSPLPLAFLVLTMLAFIGGVLYPPNNFDALIYRMPRICHWLMVEQWEWIPTTKNNLNTRSAGFEWWTVPLISIFRTDRLTFLINFISFLYLPGLLFSLFRGMGVGGKVARAWMWLTPLGYCFILQAASIGNDMIMAFHAVAAFSFGFRWKKHQRYTDFALSIACCAMMTAIKPVTLPLLLPFAFLFFGMWRTAFSRPITTCILAFLMIFASFLPTAVINIKQCGDWTGASAEDVKLGQVEPMVGIATNSINTVLQNSFPPVFPMANMWNSRVTHWFPKSYIEANHRSFEAGGANFSVADFQGEESVGLGFGVTWLLLLTLAMSVIHRLRTRFRGATRSSAPSSGCIILLTLYSAALLAYFSRAGMSTVARHIAPFYPFFIALVLVWCRPASVMKSLLWKFAATACVASSLIMVCIVPSRPLWPSRTLLAHVSENSPKILQRAKLGYDVYANRADGLGPIRDVLPKNASHIGYLSFGSSAELPLWKPYLTRKLRHIRPQDSVEILRSEGIRYAVINTGGFESKMNIPPAEWITANHGLVIHRIPLQLQAKLAPTDWWIVDFSPPQSSN